MDPISDFDFGKNPVADKCVLETTCMENYKLGEFEGRTENLWFMSNINTNLFYFYEDPIDQEMYMSTFQARQALNSEKFVAIKVKNKQESKKYPKNVRLRIGYSQIGKTHKKIINAGLYFSGFEAFDESSAEQMYQYNLRIEWFPLTHTELTIEFALTWKLYLVLYLAVGIMSFLTVNFMFMVHLGASRRRKNYFKCCQLFRVVWSPAFVGISYTLFILIFYYAIAGFICFFKIMNYSLRPSNCTKAELECASYAPLDFLAQQKFQDPDNYSKLRR